MTGPKGYLSDDPLLTEQKFQSMFLPFNASLDTWGEIELKAWKLEDASSSDHSELCSQSERVGKSPLAEVLAADLTVLAQHLLGRSKDIGMLPRA